MMQIYLLDWVSVSLKLFHIVVGIAWIGASFYFNWLENKLNRLSNRDEIAGHLWAVHGGGFYYLEKYKKYPENLPEPLHWFKWEAYFTWISGILLLSVIYYFNASTYLLISDSSMLPAYGVALSLLGLLVIWIIYDLLCKSKLVDKPIIFIGILFLIITLSAYLYSDIFNPRAVYMQIGSMIGTIMVANVFFVIIPVQKELVTACIDKTQVSRELGLKGYIRSRHNNYFTLPVVFTMISAHYPGLYSGTYGWLVLIAIMGILVLIRHYFNLRGVGQATNSLISLIILAIIVLVFALSPSQNKSEIQEMVSISEVKSIIDRRCTSCHSDNPTDDVFTVAPSGFMLNTEEQIIASKNLIYQRTVATHSMPFNNKTNMTETEREKLKVWFEAE
jgi:uncharacterized membrane protein